MESHKVSFNYIKGFRSCYRKFKVVGLLAALPLTLSQSR